MPSFTLAGIARFARRPTFVAAAVLGCSGASGTPTIARTGSLPAADGHLFTLLPSTYTGVTFANRVTDTQEQNVFTYRNHYNGGGVAIGDLTGDGLPEVVLTSNEGGARLYRNEGKFRFRDVSAEAGFTNADGAWTTGVTLADVNGDGRLDVYVCHAGNAKGVKRANQLYVNDGVDARGVLRFTERAAEYGIADGGYATQAAFFDYDHDGDLDLFVIRNSPRPVTSFGMRNTRTLRDSLGGARLYRNDRPSSAGGAPHFVDVTASAGIFSPEIAFGLGLGVADVDGDGWPDVYVSNDFFERDYLYLNQHDGTFREVLDREMPYGSYFSMGMDIADVNNDGRPDIYTTDMLPQDERRIKETSAAEGWDAYQLKLRNGYSHQIMRNMLQLNAGGGRFSDVAQMAGVARTDWSWGALLVDLDLDGNKDVFVTNGIAKDVTSQDYISSIANQTAAEEYARGGHVDYLKLVNAMTSTRIPNYAFRNAGGAGVPSFTNVSAEWGLASPSFSSGAAYGDLDGDGAPDLVVNNVNDEAFVYRNNARTVPHANHWLQVRLEGQGANRFGVGARVSARAGGETYVQELEPTRGFQSSSDYVLTFGLGAQPTTVSLMVEWPDGRRSVMDSVVVDRRLTVRQSDAGSRTDAVPRGGAMPGAPRAAAVLADVTDSVGLDFVHHENDFVDFDRDRMVPKFLSTEGPAMAVGDVNGDGLDDVFFGGAKEQGSALYIQQRSGRFVRADSALFVADAASEAVGATFFDANGDGRPDLYVVSGGSEYSSDSPALQDVLYMNDGNGRFHKAVDALPPQTVSGSRVVAADYDGDGAVDLFVGGRSVPWKYGVPGRSMLLRNDGRGHFTDATDRLAPGLANVGMVTDAAWADVDGDGRLDLVVVGEWMPITVFRNTGRGGLSRMSVAGLAKSNGWYSRVLAGDYFGRGHADLLAGNLGLDTRMQASAAAPATMLVKDFDGNGYVEQLISCDNGGRSYPITLRDDLLKALPYLKARFPNYHAYAMATASDVFTAKELEGAVADTAYTFASAVVRNDGRGAMTTTPLAREAQLAPVYAMLAQDVDGDGHVDLLVAGNLQGVRPEIGPMTASYGLLLRGDGRGGFAPVSAEASGFVVPGQARDIQRVRTRDGSLIVVARNNDRPLVFRSVMPASHRASAPRVLAVKDRR